MSIYRVYLPAEAGGKFSEEFRLIPDTKAIFALIAPPIWLIWNRLWLPLLVYVTVVLAIALIATWQPSPMVSYLSVLPGFYLLLEGRELVLQQMRKDGWHEAGIIEAQSREAAEIKYLVGLQENGLLQTATTPASSSNKPQAAAIHSPSIGLFPE